MFISTDKFDVQGFALAVSFAGGVNRLLPSKKEPLIPPTLRKNAFEGIRPSLAQPWPDRTSFTGVLVT